LFDLEKFPPRSGIEVLRRNSLERGTNIRSKGGGGVRPCRKRCHFSQGPSKKRDRPDLRTSPDLFARGGKRWPTERKKEGSSISGRRCFQRHRRGERNISPRKRFRRAHGKVPMGNLTGGGGEGKEQTGQHLHKFSPVARGEQDIEQRGEKATVDFKLKRKGKPLL